MADTAFQVDAFQNDAFQIEPVTPPTPVEQGTGGGGVGFTPKYRVFVHYSKEYPEESLTPVAEAVKEVAEPKKEEVQEEPEIVSTVLDNIFIKPKPKVTAEDVLKQQLIEFEQNYLILTADIKTNYLAIQQLHVALQLQEEEEVMELFMLLEA